MTGCSNFPSNLVIASKIICPIARVHISFNHGQRSAAFCGCLYNSTQYGPPRRTVSRYGYWDGYVFSIQETYGRRLRTSESGTKATRSASHGPDPARGNTANLDELTYEVLKLIEQRTNDADYFNKQIHSVTEDHGARITTTNRFMKTETARLDADILQNAKIAIENDVKTKEGLALLEAQVISNTKVKDGLALLEAQVNCLIKPTLPTQLSPSSGRIILSSRVIPKPWRWT